MKKYYLHNGTESSGPFDIEELKAKKITPQAPVWFEGMEKWKIAADIPELNVLFVVKPPPLDPIIASPAQQKTTPKTAKKQILGLSKNSFFVVLGVLILTVITIVFNTLNENRKRELDKKNYKTEVENYQLERQQKEIEEQKLQIAEAEKQAAARAIEEKKQSRANRIIEIEKLIAISQSNLETTKKKWNDASGFKVFRSATEKNRNSMTCKKK